MPAARTGVRPLGGEQLHAAAAVEVHDAAVHLGDQIRVSTGAPPGPVLACPLTYPFSLHAANRTPITGRTGSPSKTMSPWCDTNRTRTSVGGPSRSRDRAKRCSPAPLAVPRPRCARSLGPSNSRPRARSCQSGDSRTSWTGHPRRRDRGGQVAHHGGRDRHAEGDCGPSGPRRAGRGCTTRTRTRHRRPHGSRRPSSNHHRGVDTVILVGIAAAVGDFSRFSRPLLRCIR